MPNPSGQSDHANDDSDVKEKQASNIINWLLFVVGVAAFGVGTLLGIWYPLVIVCCFGLVKKIAENSKSNLFRCFDFCAAVVTLSFNWLNEKWTSLLGKNAEPTANHNIDHVNADICSLSTWAILLQKVGDRDNARRRQANSIVNMETSPSTGFIFSSSRYAVRGGIPPERAQELDVQSLSSSVTQSLVP